MITPLSFADFAFVALQAANSFHSDSAEIAQWDKIVANLLTAPRQQEIDAHELQLLVAAPSVSLSLSLFFSLYLSLSWGVHHMPLLQPEARQKVITISISSEFNWV